MSDSAVGAPLFQIIEIDHLGGMDMQCTLFVEAMPENSEPIRQLIALVKLLDGLSSSQVEKCTLNDIESYFAHPLARLMSRATSGCYDSSSVWLLRGRLSLPRELVQCVEGALENGFGERLSDRGVDECWEKSPLRCCKYPRWRTICESARKLDF